jgi:two-component system chemotaxis sensor kinase CheA
MPRLDAEVRARLEALFRVEADEHLEALGANLLELEAGPEPGRARELVEATFREMHTLKGAARSVGMRAVEALCQDGESLLSAMRDAGAVPDRAELSRLDDAVRSIRRMVAGEPEPAAPAPRAIPDAAVRMPTEKLDELLRRGEDLLAVKLAADDSVADAEALTEEIRRCRARLEPSAAGELRALEGGGRAMVARLQRDRRRIAAAVDAVLEETRRARMTPASTVLALVPIMVRDLAHAAGKECAGVVRGGDLEVDRRVLEAIKDPLIHLVRNAVGHGIERPEERAAAGKAARGRVTVTVGSLEGGRVEIVVEDDGRGVDVESVRAAAQRAGALEADGDEPLTGEAALRLVQRSGVSTSFVVTDVSGRGLGLAIVKEQVERLGGTVEMDSRPGEGVRVRLEVPATIATFRGLPVRAGGQVYLLPVGAVEHVLHPDAVDPAMDVAGLADLLGGAAVAGEAQACAVVRSGDGVAGLLVDEVLGDREVLVKELAPPLVHLRHVAGAGLMEADELALILRPADLVAGARAARGRSAARLEEPGEPEREATVLVVDDAVTTRTMERSLLELAGYRVEVAVDGLDAWTMLTGGDFDLVVSDVDMPRMDGFELTRRIRADARLAHLPVVLVTALEGREDMERGLEAGANAYVVKSSFERSNLLETIRRLGVLPGGGEA